MTTDDLKNQDLATLLEWLQDRGWVNRRQICSAFTNWDERHVRDLANLSAGKIISGQLGYKLTVYATREEIAHAVNRLRHQAKEMEERAAQIRSITTNPTVQPDLF